MKSFLCKLINIVFLLFFTMNISTARSIDDVAENMGVTSNEAKIIIKSTYALIKEVQNNFSSIASETYDYDEKIGENGLIKSTINDYFTSKQAIVEVSSVNNTRIKSPSIYQYLHRLANFSKNKTYHTIKLEFGKKIFFKDIYLENNEINISVDAFQLFEGCRVNYEGVRTCYSDITKKTFVVKVNNDREIRVDAINVKETMKIDGTNTDIILQ